MENQDFEIPGKPWKFYSHLEAFTNYFESNSIRSLLVQHRQIAIKNCTGQKIYSELLRKYIETFAVKPKIEILNYLKQHLQSLYSFICELTNGSQSPEKILDFLQNYFQRFIENLYLSQRLEEVAKEIILNGIKKRRDVHSKYLIGWINSENDIEGILFDVFADELNCKILEFTCDFDFWFIEYGSRTPGNEEVYCICFLRARKKVWVFMSIQEMEDYALEVGKNIVHLSDRTN
jgi:hypothetical protein